MTDEQAGLREALKLVAVALGATTLMTTKLMALDERACDLATVIPAARAVREQVAWDEVAASVRGNDFAEVTLLLLARLGVVPDGRG